VEGESREAKQVRREAKGTVFTIKKERKENA